jgi:hypothetical protein
MNLREYLRLDFAMHLKYLLTKDKCEWCDNIDNLHLHHVDRFHNLLIDTLQELNVNELGDVGDYPEEVLISIRDKMISKQLRSEYKTLCEPCHKKIHSIENRLDVYKEKSYNPYGSYFFLNIKCLSNLEGQYILRFLYLCCFVGYENKLTFGDATKGHNYMNIKDLEEVLKIGRTETTHTKNLLIENNLIELDEDNNISINKKIMYKGFKPNGSDVYTRFFSDFTSQMYESLTTSNHKTIGRVFSLFEYLSESNWISKNNKPINKTNICEILGYGRSTTLRIRIFLEHKIIICKNNSYFINPAFMYNGFLTKKLEDLERFISS